MTERAGTARIQASFYLLDARARKKAQGGDPMTLLKAWMGREGRK
jgi:hypothetical protein